MIRRLQENNHSVGMVIDSDEEDIMFCSTCAANGEMSKLKERIWLDNKGKRLPDPPDSDSWRMCWKCGMIIPTRDAKKSGTITGITGIEILSSPYDEKKGLILGTDSRLSSRIRNLKRHKNKHPDAEVQKLIEQGYEVVNYQQDIPVSNSNSNSNNDNIVY